MKTESEYRVLLITVLLALIFRVIGETLQISLIDEYFVLVVSVIGVVFLLLEMFAKKGK
jgi:hypothetical protein